MQFDQKRRAFITLLGAAAAWPIAARAQQRERVRRVGVITNALADDPAAQSRLTAFVQGLQQLGWSDSRNVRIDTRWGAGDTERVRRYAAELVALAPDVILTVGSPTTGPLLQATRNIPIVFVQVADPVGGGFVEALARPGGNVTGFASFEYGMSGKWLELLKEIAPDLKRAAVLRNLATAAGSGQFGSIQALAPSLGVEVNPINVRDAGEIERAITSFARSSNGGLIVTGGPRSSRWRRDTDCPPSTQTMCSSLTAACSPTGLTGWTSTGARPPTSIASSRVRNRPTSPYKRRPNMS